MDGEIYTENTLMDRVNRILNNVNNQGLSFHLLPDEHTVRDIFLDLEDDKLFRINIVDDVLNKSDFDYYDFYYQEMVLDKMDNEHIYSERVYDSFTMNLKYKLIKNRYCIRRLPKILTITPNDEKVSINEFNYWDDFVQYMCYNELSRLKDYLGEDLKRIVRDNKSRSTIIMFNSYDIKEIKDLEI